MTSSGVPWAATRARRPEAASRRCRVIACRVLRRGRPATRDVRIHRDDVFADAARRKPIADRVPGLAGRHFLDQDLLGTGLVEHAQVDVELAPVELGAPPALIQVMNLFATRGGRVASTATFSCAAVVCATTSSSLRLFTMLTGMRGA
jgi:hypothetical protein